MSRRDITITYETAEASFHRCCKWFPPARRRYFTGAKINIIFELTNIFQKKLHLMLKKVTSRG